MEQTVEILSIMPAVSCFYKLAASERGLMR
jgi:hypothetical protein